MVLTFLNKFESYDFRTQKDHYSVLHVQKLNFELITGQCIIKQKKI